MAASTIAPLVSLEEAWQQPPSKALEPDPLYRVKEMTQNTRQTTRWGFLSPPQGLAAESCLLPACMSDRSIPSFETVSGLCGLILESLVLLQKDSKVPFLFKVPKGGYDHSS